MFWGNLFKKKNHNKSIVNNIYFKIPSFEELTTEEQEYVNKLKEEYIKFYENEDEYTKLDEELINEIKMYQDLALHIMCKDHLGNIVDSIIDSKKLVYYSHKITEINDILKYKTIVLKELRKDKKYLTKYMGLYVLGRRKINILKAIDYQTNIMTNLVVISEQKIYEYGACAIASYPKVIDENTMEELNLRYIEVEKDYQDLFNTSINLDNNLSNTDKTTYMEILIDKFIYENKDLIDKLKEQLEIIASSEINDKNMQQEIIDNLMKIKMYYNIFNKYGRNKITKEAFDDLYQIIFNVYTYFPFECEFSNYYNSLEDVNEKEAYRNIIGYKVEMFNNCESTIFNDKKISTTAIKSVHQILTMPSKDDNENCDNKEDLQYENIINKYLDLLLSLEYKDGLNIYFDHHKNDEIYVPGMRCKFKLFEYYKLLMGIKKNKRNELICDLQALLKKPETLYFIKIFKSLYDVNFNVFPDGIKHFKIIFENYSFNNNLPVQFSCHDFLLDKFVKCSCPLLIPTNKDFTLYIKDDYVQRKITNNNKKNALERTKILLPTNPIRIKLCDKGYHQKHLKYLSRTPNNDDWSYPFTACYAEDTLTNLGKIFVLDEKILNYDQIKMQKYLYDVFLPIKDMFDFDDSWKEMIENCTNTNLIYIWSYFFENLSIGNNFGVIGNISYKMPKSDGDVYDDDVVYKLSIRALTNSLLNCKRLREENNKVKVKNILS